MHLYGLDSRVECCGGLYIRGRDIKFIYRRIALAQSALSIPVQYTYFHIKGKTLIESFIVKLEQSFVRVSIRLAQK